MDCFIKSVVRLFLISLLLGGIIGITFSSDKPFGYGSSIGCSVGGGVCRSGDGSEGNVSLSQDVESKETISIDESHSAKNSENQMSDSDKEGKAEKSEYLTEKQSN